MKLPRAGIALAAAAALVAGACLWSSRLVDGIVMPQPPASAPPRPTAAAPAAPSPAPAPERPCRARFGAGGPFAEGVTAFVTEAGGARVAHAIGASGEFPVPAREATIEFFDEATSLTLLQVAGVPPVPREHVLPVPLRLSGEALEGVRVRVAAGADGTPMDRVRAATGSRIKAAPNESAPWGFALPPTPRETVPLAAGDGARWSTVWFFRGDSALVTMTRRDGAFAQWQVDTRTAAPRQVIEVPPPQWVRPAALEIAVELPPQVPRASIGVNLTGVRVAPEREAAVASMLAAVDLADTEIGKFVLGTDDLFIEAPAPLRIAPVPAFDSATLTFRNDATGMVATREVALREGETTAVRVAAEDLFPSKTEERLVEVRAVLQGTEVPVPGARVVASTFFGRVEAATDADGYARLGRVPADVEVSFLVDAQDTAGELPRWSHTETIRMPRIPDHTMTIEVPAQRWLIVDRGTPAVEGMLQPDIAAEVLVPGGWRSAALIDAEWEGDVLYARVSEPGDYRLTAIEDRFLVRHTDTISVPEDVFVAEGAFRDAAPARQPTVLRFVTERGVRAPNLGVRLAPRVPGARVCEFVTDANGEIDLGACNVHELEVQVGVTPVDGAMWDYSGGLKLAPEGTTFVELRILEGENQSGGRWRARQ
jgi:hypothetical protein